MEILSSVIQYIAMHFSIIVDEREPSQRRLIEERMPAILTQSFRVLKHPGLLASRRDYYRFIDQITNIVDTLTLPEYYGQNRDL